LTAVFEIKQYVVSLDASPSNGGTVEGAGTYDCCDEVYISAEATSDCWEFVGWYDESGSIFETESATTFKLCDGDKTLVAWFEFLEHTITFVRDLENIGLSENRPNIVLDDHGQILAETENATKVDFDCGVQLDLYPDAGTGNYFNGWLIEYEDETILATSDATLLFDVTQDATITAFFKRL